jgi:geranylgeranyl reductase family protein
MIYDVVVVGAGPAGSTAARYMAEKGLRTLILDKEAFPRYKACGGALTPGVKKYLDFDYSHVVERTVKGVSFMSKDQSPHTVYPDRMEVELVSRDRFDLCLVEAALRSGAELMDGRRVHHLEEGDSAVTLLMADGDHIQARVAVGADGAAGAVARSVGLRKPPQSVAIETEIYPRDPGIMDLFGDRVWFGFGYHKTGYGWLFPKKDHFSAGIGTTRDASATLSATYEEFKSRFDFLRDAEERLRRRWLIPFNEGKRLLNRRRVCLVGDAASVVDPFSGEGIYYSLWSGAIAAEAIATDLHERGYLTRRYTDEVNKEMVRDFSYARKFGALFNSAPSFFYTKPPVVRLFVRLARREMTYSGILPRAQEKFVDLVRSKLTGTA